MPSAPERRARRAPSPSSALAHTPSRPARSSSAQPSSSSSSAGTSVATGRAPPTDTAPVEPSIEMRSPSRTTVPSAAVNESASTRSVSAPHTAGRPRPRAMIAAWLEIPPLEVSTPATRASAATSAGPVSVLTSTTGSSSARSRARDASNTAGPLATPGEAPSPTATTRPPAGASGWSSASRSPGVTRVRASIRVRGSSGSLARLTTSRTRAGPFGPVVMATSVAQLRRSRR